MKQLSGLDAAFLYAETPTTFGHVNLLLIFERPEPDFEPYPAVYAKFASLVGALEPLRRRVVEVPFGLDHPYWAADGKLDLDYHIREVNLAKPGLADQLADQVCRIVEGPMDRTRPLWEVHVIDGLQEDRWALLTKYHHATLDGAAGQLMLQAITSTSPDATPPGDSPPWEPEAIPSGPELLVRALGNLAVNPIKAVGLQTRMLQSLAATAGIDSVSSAAEALGATLKRLGKLDTEVVTKLPMPTAPAPRTPWNKAISPHRRFAMRSVSLENVKRLKQVTGGTVNDIVMAICAGGLREYLLAHNALPDRPLRAMVPVSLRTGNEKDPWTNRVSDIFPELPTNCADPLERISRSREAMLAAKRTFDLVPAAELMDLTQYSTPLLATAAVRLASQLKVADVGAPPFNVTISNVPGPRQPLYFAGAQLAHQFPVSIVTEGQGLNITLTSYLDRLDFGFIADRDLVPDLWDLADMHVAEISRLFEATGAEWAEAPRAAYPRRGPVKRTKAPTAARKRPTSK